MPQSPAVQQALLASCVAAQKKVTRATATRQGALEARDDLIRQARAAGVTQTALATATGIERSQLWKIERSLTTKKAAARTEGKP